MWLCIAVGSGIVSLQPSNIPSEFDMAASRAIKFGQNFLTDTTIADQLVSIISPPHGVLCVDLGAGKGIITEACRSRGNPVLAVEIDSRLVEGLKKRFAGSDVQIIHGNLLTCEPPDENYMIAANPPFNLSTAIIKRWIMPNDEGKGFQQGAFILQQQFARKLAGNYGASKMSLALAPFFELSIHGNVPAHAFRPKPQVATCILKIKLLDVTHQWSERRDYWQFVNYLFERSHPVIGKALQPLDLRGAPKPFLGQTVGSLNARTAWQLYTTVYKATNRNKKRILAFNSTLPPQRSLNI